MKNKTRKNVEDVQIQVCFFTGLINDILNSSAQVVFFDRYITSSGDHFIKIGILSKNRSNKHE